jgi:hypothetical protein
MSAGACSTLGDGPSPEVWTPWYPDHGDPETKNFLVVMKVYSAGFKGTDPDKWPILATEDDHRAWERFADR